MRARTRAVAVWALLVSIAGGRASGGPLEAREQWKVAQGLRGGPWRERLAALRAAHREVGETDSLYPRILAAEGAALRGAGHVSAANAAEAQAADAGPARDPSRLARALSVARTLDDEGDVVGALERLDDVLDRAGGAEFVLGPAVALRARIAAERGDGATLLEMVRRAAGLGADRVADRLAVIDLHGMVRWRAGDLAGARKALEDEKRLYADAIRRDDELAKMASRAWLRLELPPVEDRLR